MNALTDRPNSYEFGYDFNYNVWTPDTTVTLTNVKWDMQYRDVPRFPDKSAGLNRYIDRPTAGNVQYRNASYHKADQPVLLDIAYNKAVGFNYLRVSNPLQPIEGGDVKRDFYYFIRAVEYVAPNTTMLVLQLDVWQTYGYDIRVTQAFIEQGHIGIANQDQFKNYGRTYLTVPEGLSVGTEYQTVTHRTYPIMTTASGQHDILIISTVDLEGSYGTVDKPIQNTAKGGSMHGVPSGASQYIIDDITKFRAFMAAMSEFPWISSSITSISMIPPVDRYDMSTTAAVVANGSINVKQPTGGKPKEYRKAFWRNWRDEIIGYIPHRYQHLKKLLTSPYMMIEMTVFSGTPVVLKPESWDNPDAFIGERASLLPPSQRIMAYPMRYNARPVSPVTILTDGTAQPKDDGGNFVDTATQVAALPTFAIVNNQGILYQAQNAHSLAYQHQSADWSQQLALRGADLAAQQATGAMNAASSANSINQGADISGVTIQNAYMADQTRMDIAFGMGSAMMNAPAQGGVNGAMSVANTAVGSLKSALSTTMAQNNNNANLGNRNNQAQALHNTSQGQSLMVRDSNMQYAGQAARGNYANTIAGINARVNDAELTPPSVSGQMGGELMNLIHDNMNISLRFKMMDDSTMAAVGEYWLNYGYKVNRFCRNIPADFMVMDKFTYWQMKEAYLSDAKIPEGFKQALRGSLETGVRFWSNPDDIGTLDPADNRPKEGVRI